MVYAQPSICPREWHTLTSTGLWHTDGSPNFGQKARPYNNHQKIENLQNCRLCCPGWTQNKAERIWKEIEVSWPWEGIEKNYGTWRWQLYQSWLVLFVQ